MLKYTLCFIRAGNQILMLNRSKAPNMGLWNGIGGKIEPDEDPMECVIREVEEEAHWHISPPRFACVVTWDGAPETGAEGMYVFIADANEEDTAVDITERVGEGILSWFAPEWILDRHNYGVVDNIQGFLPPMLAGEEPQRWHCTYKDGFLVKIDRLDLPDEAAQFNQWCLELQRLRDEARRRPS